ncbi:MAG: hypothetical protein K2M41_05570 [Muribaculaceae bacterium]|nr:hypothetical protein [Muribaculaceae bacterium]
MTAKDVLSVHDNANPLLPMKNVDASMPLLEVLPHLLDAPGRLLGVLDAGNCIGVIDEISMLEGLGRLIAARDDSSVLTVECRDDQYSASAISHAVEDADAHLVDLISRGDSDGKIRVTLRVRANDPEAAARSLERYGYRVVESSGAMSPQSEVLAERLASLRALINI